MTADFLAEAVRLSHWSVEENGGPFGAVVVLDGHIIGRGMNRVTRDNDPTAHAEIVAIRDACRNIAHFHLENAEIYSSCEPCPMCLAAARWARVKKIVFANTRQDAENIGFIDKAIYDELAGATEAPAIVMAHHPSAAALDAFTKWRQKENKKNY